MLRAYGSPDNPLRKYVNAKEGKANRVDNAALPLPVVAKDIVLSRPKLKMSGREGTEILKF
jgi:hypothetical protein